MATRRAIAAAVVVIGVVGVVIGVFVGAGSTQADLQIAEFEAVDGNCTDVSGDPLPESTASAPSEDGRTLTVQFAVKTDTTDATLAPTLSQSGTADGRPVYRLDVAVKEGTDTADCPYEQLYELRVDVSPAAPYLLRVYHDGQYHGEVERTDTGLSSTGRAEATLIHHLR